MIPFFLCIFEMCVCLNKHLTTCSMRVLVHVCDHLFSDPPPAVNFTAVRSFSDIVVSWTALPDEPCPITNYTITINGDKVIRAGNDNQYTHPIVNECGSTLEISMFATSTAGSGNATTTNLTIFAARECWNIEGFIVFHLVDWHQCNQMHVTCRLPAKWQHW